MHKLILSALILGLTASTAFAQSYVFQGNFPDPIVELGGLGGHGVAVDPDGKFWFEGFGATDSVQVAALGNEFFPVRVIYVYNADGTPASFNPVKFVDYADGVTPRDTLGGFVTRDGDGNLAWEGRSNRGLRADRDGNILASNFNTLFKLDYQTGEGLARADFPDYCSLTQAASDDNGSVYVMGVCPFTVPIRELDSNLNFIANVAAESSNFSRSVTASANGLWVYETDYENTYTILHNRADEFSPFDSVGVAFRGMRTESGAVHPVTGNLWFSSGNSLNNPNQDPEVTTFWNANTWYEFAPSDVHDLDGMETPLDSLVWGGCTNFFDDEATPQYDGLCEDTNDPSGRIKGRPRGIAFSPDGMRAYVTGFSALSTDPGGQVQLFELMNVAIEEGAELPTSVTLGQNYPNPFTSETKIGFEVQQAAQVQLVVYDMLGREVAMPMDDYLTPNTYTATVDTRNMAPGTYVYTLRVNGQVVSSNQMTKVD
ncbi:MAG: T9SS type A sorting domain-containing protein [Bacteroidota bacterium]